MNSTRSLENSRLREELKMLRGALKDLQEDKLIEIKPKLSTGKSESFIKKSQNNRELINSGKELNKIDSLHSEDLESLFRFDKIVDFSNQELSESSLKFTIKSVEKPVELPELKVSAQNPFKNSKKTDPLYDHLLDSSLRFSIDSQSGYFEDLPYKPSDTSIPFDKIQPFAPIPEPFNPHQNNQKVFTTEPLNPSLPHSSSNNSLPQYKTFDNEILLTEIESLRKENSKLRDQLKVAQSVKNHKEPKIVNIPFRSNSPKRYKLEKELKSGSKTPKKTSVGRIVVRGGRTRSVSRSKSKSLTPRDLSYKVPGSPLTPKRYRHCNVCDHLLSKGYSTKYCSKHGISISK